MAYELFALKYAESDLARPRHENFVGMKDDPHEGPLPLFFYVWVAVGHGRVVLIDTGADQAVCEARGHRFFKSPADLLRLIGIQPEAVDTIISTHLHWDHAGNFEMFPNATFHACPQEIAFATGPCMCHRFLRRPYDVDRVCDFVRMVYADRVTFHDDSAEVAPGLFMHRAPGHTPGLCFAEVPTKRGKVVVASDTMHFYDNGALGIPFPVISDITAYLQSIKRVMDCAESVDHMIPGHDPKVMELYPPVSEQTRGLAVRLDVAPIAR
ncbi:N-acyl homoserine lactonase family protein [Tardiphaga sp.]|uniref:N-acyl homoserine lactonase family protein n=1 Tax=Tardiphaga sp. TaxID=1926292 RepID=UPI002639B8B1|nr:N-acyl homoserine lactonase family protein [Tardiphaga sp.]MDB5620740.1 fold hydrolase [Tardiphaga sp.]